jgi:predicted esterase
MDAAAANANVNATLPRMDYYHRTMSLPRKMRSATRVLLALVAIGHVTSARALAQDSAPAQAPPARGLPGYYELRLENGRDGRLYAPGGYKDGVAMPMLVWLHGAGGSGNVSTNMAALADEFKFIVLAPDAREWTWDAILGQYGPDVEFLQRAMRQTMSRYSVDRERIWLGGFSDGASYSLSLGISYGDVFKKVYAGAPGVMQPIEVNGKPSIFISHGRQDQTMPIDETSRKFVPRLKGLNYDVTYKEYEGRHQLPPEILREVIEWFVK